MPFGFNLELPNFTEWLSRQNSKRQDQLELLFMLGPFFVSWMVFSYYWVGLMWDFWDALPGPLLIGTVGYIGFFKYSEHIKGEATSLDTINMTVRWSESMTRDIQNVMEDWEILEESEKKQLLNKPKPKPSPESGSNPGKNQGKDEVPGMEYWRDSAVKYCPMCGSAVAYPNGFNNGEKKVYPSHCQSCGSMLPENLPVYQVDEFEGLFFTKVHLANLEVDPWGQEWDTAIFIHHYPKDQTLRRQPGQWVSHKGLRFPMPSSNIDVTYMGSKDELEHEKYFLVTSDPERTRRIQMGIGLTPASAELEEVNRARDLSTIKLGLKWVRRWREEASSKKVIMETAQDSDIRARANATKFYQNKDIVTSDLNTLTKLKTNWLTILGAGVGLLVIWYLLKYFNFI